MAFSLDYKLKPNTFLLLFPFFSVASPFAAKKSGSARIIIKAIKRAVLLN
jgi:hypothetical protein